MPKEMSEEMKCALDHWDANFSLLEIVAAQSLDEGLWFVATTAPEAYLQQELRRLHDAVEKHFQNQGRRVSRWKD